MATHKKQSSASERNLPPDFAEMTESVRVGIVLGACREFEAAKLTVTVSEVARMVEAKLRRADGKVAMSPEALSREIDATLDLLEECQWRIALRNALWKKRAQKKRLLLNPEISPAEKEARDRIEAQHYPVEFHAGLILIGVSGDNRAKREATYWEFFKDWYVQCALTDHRYGTGTTTVRDESEFVPPTADQLTAAFEKEKRVGWTDKWILSNTRDCWNRWKAATIKGKRSKGGKASGEARRKGLRKPVK